MAENGTITADGHTGRVLFDGSTIQIERPGLRGKIGYGGKPTSINANAVTQVWFAHPSEKANGSIAFLTPGHPQVLKGLDSHSVLFTAKQAPHFVELRDAVNALVRSRSEGAKAALAEQAAAHATEKEITSRSFEVISYAGHKVSGGLFATPTGAKSIAGASALFESGADHSRPTLTRIGAGAVIAGPAGAIVGGLFKKNTAKGYVTVEFPDGEAVIIEGPAKDETKMRQFAADVNRIAASS
ncbi:hypothetical protein [Leucobacter aridicollis]|uniref:DUF4429 domain-containing protein n=1 Tax=Leucobacter aridicollis TaxID=283878 RepID=A0A852RB07_9MICO|nr:hypothetical protein [Leucobacter aridicollis]NYD26080.1 hypothetical protein [Leucobacter aridicollis]